MANEFRFEDYTDAMTFKPVTDKTIKLFAAQQGIKFSPDYTAFLKTHNGFYFDLDRAKPLAEGVETFESIRYLHGLDPASNITT